MERFDVFFASLMAIAPAVRAVPEDVTVDMDHFHARGCADRVTCLGCAHVLGSIMSAIIAHRTPFASPAAGSPSSTLEANGKCEAVTGNGLASSEGGKGTSSDRFCM